jgi:hypothetical protein
VTDYRACLKALELAVDLAEKWAECVGRSHPDHEVVADARAAIRALEDDSAPDSARVRSTMDLVVNLEKIAADFEAKCRYGGAAWEHNARCGLTVRVAAEELCAVLLDRAGKTGGNG